MPAMQNILRTLSRNSQAGDKQLYKCLTEAYAVRKTNSLLGNLELEVKTLKSVQTKSLVRENNFLQLCLSSKNKKQNPLK